MLKSGMLNQVKKLKPKTKVRKSDQINLVIDSPVINSIASNDH